MENILNFGRIRIRKRRANEAKGCRDHGLEAPKCASLLDDPLSFLIKLRFWCQVKTRSGYVTREGTELNVEGAKAVRSLRRCFPGAACLAHYRAALQAVFLSHKRPSYSSPHPPETWATSQWVGDVRALNSSATHQVPLMRSNFQRRSFSLGETIRRRSCKIRACTSLEPLGTADDPISPCILQAPKRRP